LTIVNLSIGPVISGKAGIVGTQNCKKLKDDDDKYSGNNKKYASEWPIDECVRKKAMHDMEYTSFIFDVVIGFVCSLIGLLHIFEVKKDFVSNTGLIGLICGVIGFVLSLVYVIFNGLVYTNYYDDNNNVYKTDGDGIVAEASGSNYKCKYFDEKGNTYALYAKYSDLGKKQYNYNKDLQKALSGKDDCTFGGSGDVTANSAIYLGLCSTEETFLPSAVGLTDTSTCKNLYIYNSDIDTSIENKDISDRFLTTLILSLFVCLANIGLALFGFLLFRTPGDF
jgi:uncharacterized membrane protein (DUF485 family)